MKKLSKIILLIMLLLSPLTLVADDVQISESEVQGWFPLVTPADAAAIYTDTADYRVAEVSAEMLVSDIKRVTGKDSQYQQIGSLRDMAVQPSVVIGTLGKSTVIEELVRSAGISVDKIRGKWEAHIIVTLTHPYHHTPVLAIIGSDRRGTAYGVTTLCEAIGVSPWYWWADVTPQTKTSVYVSPHMYCQGEPSVQYRGIFINDERFGGWARWAEQTYDKETGKVGPKTYRQVFELLLRLKANYLWPAMHPGTQAFNDDPQNARLADDYAIVMGTSHCEQMLRNNEGEWKAVGTYGDFNYITNRKTMQDYWEERIRTNGRYENTYTLGLRGIHDYPMEGANTTAERVKLMQQAIDDQRDILRRNIKKPIEEIPQVLCTYEEVLDAYHNGLQVPDDVTLLWSDDKHGYCRNLSNPHEQHRKGGAGIYYHLSYHGDPSSWIWLSPLSPAFLATELHKAYTYGARKIWVFNVGDIKPAEKEISFVMDLAWDINRWTPGEAHGFIEYWTAKTFGKDVAHDIAEMQAEYYRLQAGGKDSHVWFVDYSDEQIAQRISQWRTLASQAADIARKIPVQLADAYFELFHYPIRGAAMLNEYQLLARRSMVRATGGDEVGAMEDAERVKEMFSELNDWTYIYNNELLEGKWSQFFSWQPYHWYRSEKIDPPYATPELITQCKHGPAPRFLPVSDVLSDDGVVIRSDISGDIPIWIRAFSPIRNFSKEPSDNVFCRVVTDTTAFDASATPINNVWHAPYVGPMWSQVGVIHIKKGKTHLKIDHLKPDARIDNIYLGLYPPFVREPRVRIPAVSYLSKHADVQRIPQLGYTDAMLVLPFDTVTYKTVSDAPYIEYEIDLQPSDSLIEIRTLPTLHVYEGRDACYAVQLGDSSPKLFSIHTKDFTAEWRRNVLHGYASRSIPVTQKGRQRLRIYLPEPGIAVQEILVHDAE